MASPAIPQNDPALLAAQAKAGQAGVEAYEAAKREMQGTQQSTAASALAAAENRGAPQGAMQAAMAGSNQMYDRRQAALTTAQAGLQASNASRDARMADYNTGVLEARGLIQSQADLVAAPINAQSRFAVANIEAQGRQTVDEIEARRRLKLLEMEAAYREAQRAAAARSRGGGGGGGGGSSSLGKPTQSALAAEVTSRALSNLNRARATAESAMRQTAEQSRQSASYAGNSKLFSLRQQMEAKSSAPRGPARTSQTNAEQARQAASYTAKALAEAQRKASSFSPVPSSGPRPSVVNHSSVIAAQEALRRATAQYNTAATSQRRSAEVDFTRQREQQQAAARAQREAQTEARRVALSAAPLYGEGQSFLTPQQIDAMSQSPDMTVFDLMIGQGGIQRIGSIAERLGFNQIDPSSILYKNDDGTTTQARQGDLTGMDAAAPEAFRRAMWQAGVEMEDDGYKVSAAELQNAIDSSNNIYKPGDTLYDVLQRRDGLDTYKDTVAAAERDNEQTSIQNAEDTDEEYAYRFRQLTGLPVQVLGSGFKPYELYNTASQPQFTVLDDKIRELLNSGEAEDLDQAFDELRAANEFDSRDRNMSIAVQILRKMYG
jgi:hypothetical protein